MAILLNSNTVFIWCVVRSIIKSTELIQKLVCYQFSAYICWFVNRQCYIHTKKWHDALMCSPLYETAFYSSTALRKIFHNLALSRSTFKISIHLNLMQFRPLVCSVNLLNSCIKFAAFFDKRATIKIPWYKINVSETIHLQYICNYLKLGEWEFIFFSLW